MKNDGFLRVAAATPHIRVADCDFNKEAISALLHTAAEQHVGAIVFPELCLTGYTCGDLFHDTTLLQAAEQALGELLEESKAYPLLAVVGLPAPLSTMSLRCSARENFWALLPKAIFRTTVNSMRRVTLLLRPIPWFRSHFAGKRPFWDVNSSTLVWKRRNSPWELRFVRIFGCQNRLAPIWPRQVQRCC